MNGVIAPFVAADDVAQGVALDDHGRIIVIGYTSFFGSNDFAIARLTDAGEPDLSFDTDGLFTFNFGDDDRANGVVVQPDGKSSWQVHGMEARLISR